MGDAERRPAAEVRNTESPDRPVPSALSARPWITCVPVALGLMGIICEPALAGGGNTTAHSSLTIANQLQNVDAGRKTFATTNSGTNNANIGFSAGYSSSGTSNVNIGANNGLGMSAGSQNTLIGSDTTSTTSGNTGTNTVLGAVATDHDNAVQIGQGTSATPYIGASADYVLIGQGAYNITQNYWTENLALGHNAGVNVSWAIALGANAYTASIRSVEIGDSGGTAYRLLNVAPGTENNDQVNLAQVLGVSGYSEVTGIGGSSPYTVFVGYNAASENTGLTNTAVGYSAGWSASGNGNLALGSSVGWSAIGNNNLALGTTAGFNNAGDDNLDVGYYAGLASYNTALGNIIIGLSAGMNSYHSDEIYLGNATGQYDGAGDENIALGDGSGGGLTGTGTVMIGAGAGNGQVGTDNIGIGNNSVGGLSGSLNTNLGYYSGQSLTGDLNTLLGSLSGFSVTGSANALVGAGAGNLTSGYGNTAFGISAGNSITGSFNITIGASSGTKTVGNDVIALGVSSGVGGMNSRTLSLGQSADALQHDALALGTNATSNDVADIAIGISAATIGNDAIAIGSSATAHGANAIALGSGAANSTANTVEFGVAGMSQRLLNIADGTQLDDAVNVEQLVVVSGAMNSAASSLTAVSGSLNANVTAATVVQGTVTTAFGNGAAKNITFGENAGAAGLTGSYNTLLGYSSGNNFSGTNGIALGASAGNGVTADGPIALGFSAGASQNGGLAIGTSAQASASNAIAIGSGVVNTSANTVEFGSVPQLRLANIANAMSVNDAVNVSQLQAVSGSIGAAIPAALGKIGSENVALAAGAGATQVTGSYQVAIGVSSGNSVTGTANAAIGQFAGNGIVGVINNDGYDSVSGYDNLSLGTSAGNAMSGDRNVAMGFAAGTGVVGTDNIGIGSLSGDSVTGSENIGIGLSAGHAVGHGIVGSGNTSGVTGALSLGAYASVAGADEVAMGTSAWVSGLGAAALGWSASASGNAAIAFGQGAITPIADTVTFGSSNVAERLSNLDTGVNANDAINFGQLAALTAATNTEVNSLESDLGFSPTQPTAANCCQTGAGSSNGAASTSNSASSGGTATGAQTSGNNLAVGGSALNSVVGTYATGLGYAGASLIVGDENTGAGAFASRFITGFQNTGIGFVASRLTTGTGNTGFGTSSSIFVSGDFNTGIGYASSGSVTGSGNVAFGANAGRGVVGDTTIAIGTNAGSDGALQGTQPGYTISTPVNEIAFTSGPSNVSTSAIVTSPQAAAQNIAVTTSSTLDVVGSDTIALGRDAGVGRDTGVNVTQALALGLSAAAAAPQALALGTNASTSALGGVALGLSASAGANRSVALGYASVATDADTVSVGAPSINSNFRASGSSSLATSGVSSTNSGVSAIAPTTNGSSGVTPLAPFTLGNPLGPQSIGSTTLASTAALQPRRIVNVAAGINTSDVATYGQLTAVGNTFHALSNAVGSVNMNANRGTAMAIAQVGAQAGGASPGRTRIGFGGGYYSGVAAVGLGVTSADTTGTRMLSFGSALTPGASNFSFGIAARWRTGRATSHAGFTDDVASALPHMRQNMLTHGADLGYSAFSDPATGGISGAEMDPKFWQLVAQSARNSGYSDILRLSENAYIATIHGHAYRVALTKGRLHSKTQSEWRLWIERIANPDDVANGRLQRWLSPGVVAGLSRAALTARAQDLMLNDSDRRFSQNI